MSISTKFPVAVHVLSILSLNRQATIYSDYIAASVNTNPVVIRRIVGLLKKAGLVDSAPGMGGVTLLKEPQEITLYDIYNAVSVKDKQLFSLHQDTNPECIVGKNIQQSLVGVMRTAEEAMEDELKKTTLADTINEITVLEARSLVK
ncbi:MULTISPECIES: Rrf2 family transcriptional regulator [Carnobacterium]|uniref:Rrf2 family transcriptional regulator n=1 Tax=Carnobacterium TaxID=2747 RepID=UPI0028920D5C|nr:MULTISPECIES: Rrf2 family transcriptional regulator [Carnobacterium]MDT1940848.1 Rrf2 family transcriptional regulator [Carnobacterium divergens]MDT1943287.1 Rrf2 family transcriptional regulator [Carnobacterium divergens]MDT1949094.1 Rrf2 family transcriptional regulator [Carnobacterium divergens]MDT1951617.1 Rrf2 family transcriptional regulator [Carnobacterium divergens]MDT1956752.1 Rrf2 family transcriptional regulator [Carnobacterium divergens]